LDQISNLVVISDTHCGCRLGLCPPGPVMLDEGVKYFPSDVQSRVWAWWEEFWGEWIPDVTRGEPYAVVVNGDATDGRHHGSVTQISHNLDDQAKIARLIMAPVVEKCEGRLYWIRGTEAHSGPSGEMEESLARDLKAIPNEIGQHARYEMWIRIGGKALVHVTHAIGATGSMAYESTAPMKELTETYVEAGRWHDEPPDVVVRSHRHRNIEVRIQTYKGFCTACTTGGWQLKTPFVYRGPARMSVPQIGGSLVRHGDEDTYTRHFIRTIGRPAEVKL
jgi:hypothetical protein